MLVPLVRDDSLLTVPVEAYATYAEKHKPIFLMSGKPREEPDGPIPWDATIRKAFTADIDKDGHDELVTVNATLRARLPRGVWVHSFPDGLPMDSAIIGAMPEPTIFHGDFDADGKEEVFLATGASDNGAEAGGMADTVSYLVAFDLDSLSVEKWKREVGGKYTQARIISGDFDGDGKAEFASYTLTTRGQPKPTTLLRINPADGEQLHKKELTESLVGMVAVDLDRDTRDELVTLSVTGEIEVFNDSLGFLRRGPVNMGSKVQRLDALLRLKDVDGDGVSEIIVQRESDDVFLDPDLRPKAVVPGGGGDTWGLISRGLVQPSYVYRTGQDSTHAFKMTKNSLYLFNRFKPWLFRVGFAGTWLLALMLVIQFYRKIHALEIKQQQTDRRRNAAIQKLIDLEKSPVQDGFHFRLIAVLKDNLSDSNFNIEVLAATMGYSTKTLQRKVKEEFDGLKPSELLMQCRVTQAKTLLSDSRLSIKEIAHTTGFKRVDHFSTTFKKQEGFTPTAYRASTQKSTDASE